MPGLPDEPLTASPRIGVEVLDRSVAGGLRLSFWSRYDSITLADEVLAYPGRSVWKPETSEYAVARPWRRRPEIAELAELSAMRSAAELVDEVASNVGALGGFALLMVEFEEMRRPAFYAEIGLNLLEEVVTFELRRLPELTGRSRLVFRRADMDNVRDLSDLLQVDGAAFPWVWRNSADEFRAYSALPGVETFIGSLGDHPIACLSTTAYLGFGHIDRIAVLPEHQGHGFGAETMRFALRRLASGGAKKIGLSTQKTNVRSQRLYEGFGFRRAATNDYRLYGRILALPQGVTDMFTLDG